MSNNEDARQIIPQLLRNHRNTISTISHEIRNPLTLVSSALQVMEKQNPELKDIPHWSQVMGDVDFIIQLLEELSACTDTGCGITPEQMECIFQPFVTYKPGGTGLGLAFSRKIAEAHEGTLTAVSTPQESTTFTVTLPV